MSAKQISLCVFAVLLQINGLPARRIFGNSVAVVGNGYSSVGAINHGSNLKIYDEHGNVHIIDENKGNNVVIIGDDAANVKVIPGKGKGFGNVKVIEGADNSNVMFIGDGGNSMVVVGNNGGSVGMVGGGVSVGHSFGNLGKSGSVSFNGASVSSGPRGVSVVSTSPGVIKSSHASVSPFGTGAFAGANAGVGAFPDANNLLNFVTSATGMGMPFFPF